MKTYISGKITGLDIDVAQANFEEAERLLRASGHEPINPMKLPDKHDKSWESYMRECIAAMVKCDAIFLLPNWHLSVGARIEFNLACELGMKVINHGIINIQGN